MVDSIFLTPLLDSYKELNIVEINTEHIKIVGFLRLEHSYELIPYRERFEVEIMIPRNYPIMLPSIKEIGGALNRKYEHINYEGTLCLEVERAIRSKLSPKYDLIEWIEEFVFLYFYSYCYHRDYGSYPFGDRSHGAKGILEYYKELLKENTLEETRDLLNVIKYYKLEKKYKGHNMCPCGSFKKIRDCHKLEKLKQLSIYADQQMIKDLKLIEWEEKIYEN